MKERTMNMMPRIKQLFFLCLLLASISVLVVPATAEEQRAEKRDTAGQEMHKASGSEAGSERAVPKETAEAPWDKAKTESAKMVEQTRETGAVVWDTAKKESQGLIHTVGETAKEVLTKAKTESRKVWEEGKAAIHEVTAPAPPVAPAKPVASPPAAPAEPVKPATPPPAK
jgi:hypothetical protein